MGIVIAIYPAGRYRADHESLEGRVSQLKNSQHRETDRCAALSLGVARQDPRSLWCVDRRSSTTTSSIRYGRCVRRSDAIY